MYNKKVMSLVSVSCDVYLLLSKYFRYPVDNYHYRTGTFGSYSTCTNIRNTSRVNSVSTPEANGYCVPELRREMVRLLW